MLTNQATLADWDDYYHKPIANGSNHSPLWVGIGHLIYITGPSCTYPSIWFSGEPGMGKTHLAKILGVLYASVTGKVSYYCNWTHKIRQLQEAMDGGPSTTLEREKAANLLVLDDLGAERVTHWELTQLYDVVNARYERRLPTIFTSNCMLDQVYKGHVREGVTKRVVFPPFYDLIGRSARFTDDAQLVQVQAERIRDRLKVKGGGMLVGEMLLSSEKGSYR